MKIKAGTSAVEIPVEPGTPMGGYGARSKPSTGTHDPLHASTLFIDVDGSPCVITSCDVVGLEKNSIDDLKLRIHEKHGIPPELILVSATHTHSGPRNIAIFGHPWKHSNRVIHAIEASIDEAMDGKFDARLEIAKGEIEGVSFNRRVYDETSSVVDDECVVLNVLDSASNQRAILYNFSCHPVVMGADNLEITADWPFFANQELKTVYPEVVPIFLQGSSGNLNPVNTPIVGNVPQHDFSDVKEIGSKTGKGIVKVMKTSRELSIGPPNGAIVPIDVVADDKDKNEIFTFATGTTTEDTYTVHTVVQAISIGELSIIGIPGELFAEIGKQLKAMGTTVMVAGYANDYIGYIPTAENYRAGGYEVAMMSLSEDEGNLVRQAAGKALDIAREVPVARS